MSKLVEKRQELEAKQKRLMAIFEESGPDRDMAKVKSIEGDTVAKVNKIRELNKELEDLANEVKALAEVDVLSQQTAEREKLFEKSAPPVQPQGPAQEPKTIGDVFVDKLKGAGYRGGNSPVVGMQLGDLKTLMERSAGWGPESLRTGKVVPDAQRPVQVTDIFPTGTTGSAAIKFMEETTFTNNAAERSEGGAYGEAAFALTERSWTVETIGVVLPITDEQMEDVAEAKSYINQRLPFMLRQRLDYQLLRGNGATPNIVGIVPYANVGSQAKGADPVMDAIFKAMTVIRVTGRASPTHILLHPNDWQGIRLERTVDGIYIMGNPSEAGAERLWGLPVVQTDCLAENSGLVGDFVVHAQLFFRRDIQMKITDGYSDYFAKGKQMVRADVRVCNVIYRPEAFCNVTGI